MGLDIYFRVLAKPNECGEYSKEIWYSRSLWDFHNLVVVYLEETRKITRELVNDCPIELFYEDIINLGCIAAVNDYNYFSLWEELEHMLYKQQHVYYHAIW